MFVLHAEKNKLEVSEREELTSGSVNVYPARFTFSKDWEGLEKAAVFRVGAQTFAVPPDENGECLIPWEVLADWTCGRHLYGGVYGTLDGEVVLPTVWADLGVIREGVSLGKAGRAPTPGLYDRLLAELGRRGDALMYDGETLTLLSGERSLSAVPLKEGIRDHRALENREAADQHPIEAISGLEEITNMELLELWNE